MQMLASKIGLSSPLWSDRMDPDSFCYHCFQSAIKFFIGFVDTESIMVHFPLRAFFSSTQKEPYLTCSKLGWNSIWPYFYHYLKSQF